MAILKCDFGTFSTKVNEITNLVNEYNEILTYLIQNELEISQLWKSEAEKAYYSKFMERKADLEQLSVYYSNLINCLTNILNTYQNIEGKYS